MLKDYQDESDLMEQVRIGAIKDKERAAHYDIAGDANPFESEENILIKKVDNIEKAESELWK